MTKSLSSPSLYKSGYVAFQVEETKLIDSNALFEKRLKELQEVPKEAPKEFVAQEDAPEMANDLEAANVARLLGEDVELESGDFSQGLAAKQVPIEAYTGPGPEELIENPALYVYFTTTLTISFVGNISTRRRLSWQTASTSSSFLITLIL